MRRRLLFPLVGIVVVTAGLLAATIATDGEVQLGLDLQGGFSVVLSAPSGTPQENIDQGKDIIRQRVDALGVAEPEVVRQGSNVIVNLPGVKDREKALEIIGTTAKMEFRPVLAGGLPINEEATGDEDPCEVADTTTTTTSTSTTAPGSTTTAADGSTTTASTTAPTTTTTTAATTTAPADGSSTTAPAEGSTTTTPTPAGEEGEDGTVVWPTREGDQCLSLGPAGFGGDALRNANAETNLTTGEWLVTVGIKGGSRAAANTTFNACFNGDPTCPTQSVAIALDREVISFPQVQDTNLADNPTFQITGDFTEGEAKDLASFLKYGALPVEFTRSAEQQVSATLGEDSLRAGLLAGLIGIALVALYIVLYYRGLGLVVILGLAVWGALMYVIVCYLSENNGLALSLAGVTGIIVSVGTTVDSYIVYFERLKDEIREGRSVRASTERSFNRAFRTILTADVASFLGASLLYVLTVGPVRGFAFFLGLSVILDIIVAWFFTRPLVVLLGRSHLFTEARFIGIARGLGRRRPEPGVAVAGGQA